MRGDRPVAKSQYGLQGIKSAVLAVDRERGAKVGLTTVLNGLSARSQNALRQRSFGTDEGVRTLVGKYGSAALKALPNLGKESHEEICAAFGFDPEERLRLPGREKHEADRLRAVPNLARDRHNRNARLLDIFEADPDLTRVAEHPRKSARQSPEEIGEPSDWDLG